MDTLVQWEPFDRGGNSALQRPRYGWQGRGTLFVDVAAERRRLQGVGIVIAEDIKDDYLAQMRDPDGNLRTPGTPFPPRSAGMTCRPHRMPTAEWLLAPSGHMCNAIRTIAGIVTGDGCPTINT